MTVADKVIDNAKSQVGVHEGKTNGHWNNDQKMCEASGEDWHCNRKARTGKAEHCDMHRMQQMKGRELTKPGKVRSKTKINAQGLVWCKECEGYSDINNFRMVNDKPSTLCIRHRKDLDLKATYNITIDQYEEMLATQAGTCFISNCDVSESLAVDHDHACCSGEKSCGKCVRGLLCYKHNLALGLFNDDVEALRLAADYLEFNKKEKISK